MQSIVKTKYMGTVIFTDNNACPAAKHRAAATTITKCLFFCHGGFSLVFLLHMD